MFHPSLLNYPELQSSSNNLLQSSSISNCDSLDISPDLFQYVRALHAAHYKIMGEPEPELTADEAARIARIVKNTYRENSRGFIRKSLNELLCYDIFKLNPHNVLNSLLSKLLRFLNSVVSYLNPSHHYIALNNYIRDELILKFFPGVKNASKLAKES